MKDILPYKYFCIEGNIGSGKTTLTKMLAQEFNALTLLEQFAENPFPNGWSGAFAALPFAIWFFLGIEGVANVAEEAAHPQRDILKGFGSALVTLVILCVLVFIAAIGVGGWEKIVYNADGAISDSPLPLAMGMVVGESNWLYHLLISIGLFGLVASFHGLILASGRATMEFGKMGYAPRILGNVSSKFQTPAVALIANMLIGIIALRLRGPEVSGSNLIWQT